MIGAEEKEPGFYSQPKSWATMVVSVLLVMGFVSLLKPTERNRQRGF